MAGCSYFDSDHWQRLLQESVSTWGLRDFAERSGLVDTSTFLETAAETLEIDPDQATLADLSGADWFEPEESALRAAWVSRWDIETTCPHEAHADGRCLFHLPPERTDPDQVRAAFREAITDPERSSFVGARFDVFDHAHEVLAREFNHAIDLRYATFGTVNLRETTVDTRVDLSFATVDELDWRNAEFGGRVSGVGLTVDGRADITNGEFAERLWLQHARFGAVTFQDATFGGGAVLDHCTITGPANLRYLRSDRGVRFRWAQFRDTADFHDAHFERGATFEGASFDGSVDLRHGTFRTGTTFEGATFEAPVDCYDATFGRRVAFTDTTFRAEASFDRAQFHTTGRFDGTRFGGRAGFAHAQFEEVAAFKNVTVGGVADFEAAEIKELAFENVRSGTPIVFADAELHGGEISYTDPPTAEFDLKRATLGPVQLRFGDVDPFDRLHIVETRFSGFEFSDAEHRRHLTGDWQLHEPVPETGRYEAIENTYLKAKNGANEVGDNRAASEFFLKEMKYRRDSQFALARDGTGLEQGLGLGKWATSWFFYLTCGYGERPENTLLSAIGTILLFAGGFYAAGIELANPLNYGILSVQSFVSLIFGDLPSASLDQVRLLSSIEAFIGAFFIGLFVFSLTRSIHR